MSVSREGLTRELLVKHNCLHLSWLFAFQSCAGHMHHFVGCIVTSYLRKLLCLQLLKSSHSLSITQPSKLNPIINIGYKRLNKITVKFGTELKPKKHIVVNYNFTPINPFITCLNLYYLPIIHPTHLITNNPLKLKNWNFQL